MQLVRSEMSLKLIVAVCALLLSSCENREKFSESYKRILVSNISTAKGYAKAFNLKPVEVEGYYLDLFRLYLLDKNKFKNLKLFLSETGEDLTEKNVGLSQIYKSALFNATCDPSNEKDYFFVSLSIKHTLVARFMVSKASSKFLVDNEVYEKIFTDFVSALKTK